MHTHIYISYTNLYLISLRKGESQDQEETRLSMLLSGFNNTREIRSFRFDFSDTVLILVN